MPILGYTTKVDAHRTVNELQRKLAAAGAIGVAIDYQRGVPDALTFTMMISNAPVSFRLPSNWQGVQRALERQKVDRRYRTPEHALSVSWRILKTWVEAQLAIVEAGLATLPQVMLPHAVTPTGQTLYELLEEHGPSALQLGEGS